MPVVAILAELATLCIETSPGPEDIETSADAASCIWRATRLVAWDRNVALLRVGGAVGAEAMRCGGRGGTTAGGPMVVTAGIAGGEAGAGMAAWAAAATDLALAAMSETCA